MNSSGKKHNRPESLRDGLIAAGLKLLREESLENISLRRVAATAGVTHAATYRHFKDKEALVAAIAQEGYRLFYAFQEEALRGVPADDFPNRLRLLGLSYVHFVLEHPHFARIMFGQAGLEFRSYGGLVRASARNWRRLRSVIGLGQRLGLVQLGNARQKTLAAWAMVHGMSMLLLDGQIARPESWQETDELVAGVIGHVYLGLTSRAIEPATGTRATNPHSHRS